MTLMVVETEDNVWLGTVKREGETLTIYTGFAGRPKVLHLDEVECMTPADEHPDVEHD
jgi:hypothetical protein